MKYDRHAKILDIIENEFVETQEDLAQKLKDSGIDVTQATVSRDIKELRLVKTMDDSGRYRYSAITKESSLVSDKLLTILRQAYVSCDYANNIVVIKTLPGMAQAVASVIDSLSLNETIGTIAGDDSIMIVCRAEKIADELVDRFSRMVKGS